MGGKPVFCKNICNSAAFNHKRSAKLQTRTRNRSWLRAVYGDPDNLRESAKSADCPDETDPQRIGKGRVRRFRRFTQIFVSSPPGNHRRPQTPHRELWDKDSVRCIRDESGAEAPHSKTLSCRRKLLSQVTLYLPSLPSFPLPSTAPFVAW